MKAHQFNFKKSRIFPGGSVFGFAVLGILLLCPVQGYGQVVTMEETSGDSLDIIHYTPRKDWDFFDSEELLKLTLEFDFKEFTRGKRDLKYQDAVLKIHLNEFDSVVHEIRIRPRGIMRLNYCTFPPIKFNFKKSDSTSVYVGDETTMKLVTHCKDFGNFEEWLLKEFLVYRMYNIMTEMSFRVRLVEMQYIDTGKKGKTMKKYGFLIEHLNSVADRNNAMPIDNEKLSQKLMDPHGMARVALFNYMIGNTDWSVTGLHNIKVLKVNDFLVKDPQPIPYDFDYSGLVNTEYAIPTEGLGLESVRDRLYRGICLNKEVTDETIRLFLQMKMQLYDVIENFELLSKNDKKDMIEYMDGFFRILDSNFLIQRDIYSNCIEF